MDISDALGRVPAARAIALGHLVHGILSGDIILRIRTAGDGYRSHQDVQVVNWSWPIGPGNHQLSCVPRNRCMVAPQSRLHNSYCPLNRMSDSTASVYE